MTADTVASPPRPSRAERICDRTDQRRADHDAVGGARRWPRACAGGLDAEADRHRQVVWRLILSTAAATRAGIGRGRAGDAGDRDVVDEAGSVGEHRRQPAVVGGRRRQADEVEAGVQRRQAKLVVGFRRQVDDDQAVDAGRLGVGEEARVAVGVDRVVVAHQHDRRVASPLRNSRTMASVLTMVWPAFSARWPEAWIAGPSAIGSENGMPSSMTSAPAAGSAFRIASEVA